MTSHKNCPVVITSHWVILGESFVSLSIPCFVIKILFPTGKTVSASFLTLFKAGLVSSRWVLNTAVGSWVYNTAENAPLCADLSSMVSECRAWGMTGPTISRLNISSYAKWTRALAFILRAWRQEQTGLMTHQIKPSFSFTLKLQCHSPIESCQLTVQLWWSYCPCNNS